jgi:hypothetical protein
MLGFPSMCVLCQTAADELWLENHRGCSVRCLRCGRYTLELALHRHLRRARDTGDQHVFRHVPKLQRAIAAANAANEVPYYTLDTWEAFAAEPDADLTR